MHYICTYIHRGWGGNQYYYYYARERRKLYNEACHIVLEYDYAPIHDFQTQCSRYIHTYIHTYYTQKNTHYSLLTRKGENIKLGKISKIPSKIHTNGICYMYVCTVYMIE